MRARFLLVGTLVCAIVLFVWQSLANTLIPWHEANMREFRDADAFVRTLRASAPENGVYWAEQGVLAAIRMTPDLADQSSDEAMMPLLVRQLALDVVIALLLCMLVLRVSAATPLGIASTLALAGFTTSLLTELSNWNWYGFTAGWSLVNVADHTIGFFLAGLTLGALLETKWLRPRGTTAEAPGARAAAGMGAMGGRETVAR